jgi:hypothetical protein
MKIVDFVFSPAVAAVFAPLALAVASISTPHRTTYLEPLVVEPVITTPETCAEVLTVAMQQQNSLHWHKGFVIDALIANLDTPNMLLAQNLDAAYESMVLSSESRERLVVDSIVAIEIGRNSPLCSSVD